MSLAEIIEKYQKEIADESILIEYNLFFTNVVKQDCKFVLDDSTEIRELDDILLTIKRIDKNAEIYVSTYGISYLNNKIFIYADTLWINTIMEIKEISNLFKNNPNIEPSDIALWDEDETMDGAAALVVLEDGKGESYKSLIEKREPGKIKSLYWD
ncbi:MAG: hypothetical protein HDR04_04025 [Lachnospiraceae bacterium]|nr:hypothetical protein [Lachnospiraceae bacterium]